MRLLIVKHLSICVIKKLNTRFTKIDKKEFQKSLQNSTNNSFVEISQRLSIVLSFFI